MEKLNLIEIGKGMDKSFGITEQEANRAIKAYNNGAELCYENGKTSVKLGQDGTMYIDGIDVIFAFFCPLAKDGYSYKKGRGSAYQNKLKSLVKRVVISSEAQKLVAAFQNFTELEEAVLPDTVDYLYNPFMNCPKLKAYELPANLKTIGGELFGIYPEKIELPNGLEKVHESTFEGTQLKSVKIPSSVKILPYAVFKNCTELNEVIFEEGIETIESSIFINCYKLNNVVFPKSLKEIGSSAFYNCKSLENVTFLGKTKIARNSFSNSPCQNTVYPMIFDSIDTVEYKGDTAKIKDYEKIVSKQQSKSLYEQAKAFSVLVNDYEVKTTYSDIDQEKSKSASRPLVDFCDFDAFVLKNGIIVGIVVKGKTVLEGQCICTYFAIDEDGTGRDEVEEYTTLIFNA